MNENKDLIDNEDEGISLSDLGKKIYRGKIYGLITFIILFLLIYVFARFVYNPSKSIYSSTFSYTNIPYLSEEINLDGTSFNYMKIVNYSEVEKVKNSNEKFANINIEAMYENNDISIYETRSTIEGTKEVDIKYTLEISAKYFEDARQAKDFFYALTNIPIDYNREIAENRYYDNYLTLSKNTRTYYDQVSYLEQQMEFLNDEYDLLIENYGNKLVKYTFADEVAYKSLNQLKEELNLNAQIKGYSNLKYDLSENSYIKDYEYEKATVDSEIAFTNRAIEDDKLLKDSLENQLRIITSGGSPIDNDEVEKLINEIKTLNIRIAQNQSKLKDLQAKKTKLESISPDDEASKQFGLKLDEYTKYLEEQTKILSEAYSYLNIDAAFVTYYDLGVISSKGGISTILLVIGDFVLSFGAGLVVAGVVGSKRKEIANE